MLSFYIYLFHTCVLITSHVSSCRLKPLDVQFMKAIHNKVNVVPVIAKADTLTLKERERLKRRVTLPNSSTPLLNSQKHNALKLSSSH